MLSLGRGLAECWEWAVYTRTSAVYPKPETQKTPL